MISYAILPKVLDSWLPALLDCNELIFGSRELGSWSKYPPLIMFALTEGKGIKIPNTTDLDLLSGNLNGKESIVGFKFGSFRSDSHYHSSKGGVLPKYRRRGIAKQLQHLTDLHLQNSGITKYTFNNIPNIFPKMFLFGINHGFTLYNVEKSKYGIKVFFQKNYDGSYVKISEVEDHGTGYKLENFHDVLRDEVEITGWEYQDEDIVLLVTENTKI